MSASKSTSRKPAANKARKKAKPRAAAKSSSKVDKRQATGVKAAAPRGKQTVTKKDSVIRKTKAVMAATARTTVNVDTLLQRGRIPESPTSIAEIDRRIAIVRDNLRELAEQAASYSGASDEELTSARITEQEMKLALLKRRREELSQSIKT